jgi:hypothetical protein
MSYMEMHLEKFLGKKLSEIMEMDFKSMPSDGLFSGRLGLIYFYYILYKEKNERSYLIEIEAILTYILARLDDGSSDLPLSSSLSNGLSGFGFIISLLIKENILEDEFENQLENINDLVSQSCLNALQNNDFDYINGSIGMLYYLNFVGAKQHVQTVTDKVYDIFTKSCFQFYNNNGVFEGIHFGYAHGLPAIVKVLDEIESNEKCIFIIKSILNELHGIIVLNDIYIDHAKYYLPRSIYKNTNGELDFNWRPALTWSNSDLNFSTLVYSLKKDFVDEELFNAANEIATATIHRQESNHTMISDHRFFFGSSGVAQMYSKLFDYTKNHVYYRAHLFWLGKTHSFLTDPQVKIEHHPLDLINNLTGAFLSLYEYKHPKIKGWDKIFLL